MKVIFMGTPDFAVKPLRALAEAGYLTSLNDLDNVKDRMDSLASVTYDGDVVTDTAGVSILGTYYNKDLFAQAGIESEPQTWDEFLEDCKKLKDAGATAEIKAVYGFGYKMTVE